MARMKPPRDPAAARPLSRPPNRGAQQSEAGWHRDRRSDVR